VIAIRDIVMSSVYRSEHAPRYHNEPHIRVLSWDRSSLLYLLGRKLQRLPASFLMRQPTAEVTLRDWLGLASVTNEWGARERIEDYLIRHTRLIRQRRAGRDRVPEAAVRDVVARCAKRFGDSQLAQCANQVSADLMPQGAALHSYSELYTSTQTYISGVLEEIRSIIRLVGAVRFPRGDLESLR
jgi:hypothetical protein